MAIAHENIPKLRIKINKSMKKDTFLVKIKLASDIQRLN